VTVPSYLVTEIALRATPIAELSVPPAVPPANHEQAGCLRYDHYLKLRRGQMAATSPFFQPSMASFSRM